MLIRPIKQWRSGDRLVDPTGADYSPSLPPEIIKDDEVLFSALLFGYENQHRIGVTVLSGLRTVAEDLGIPGEFEAHMAKADIYGSDSFGGPQKPGTEGYGGRLETAMIHYGRDWLRPFCTVDWRGMRHSPTAVSMRSIEAALDNSEGAQELMGGIDLASLDLPNSAPEDAEKDSFTAAAHMTNHWSWITVANACDQVQSLGRGGDINVLLDEGVSGAGVARVFGYLGIRAELHESGKDRWPSSYPGYIAQMEQTLSTGHIAG